MIWYAPYKLLTTSQGIFELPKVVMFDCKTENYDNLIKYNEERICSSEQQEKEKRKCRDYIPKPIMKIQ